MTPNNYDPQALIAEMAAVWRFVVHLCTSEQAEFVVQEIYLRAFSRSESVPPTLRRDPKLWLFRIACDVLHLHAQSFPQNLAPANSPPTPSPPVADDTMDHSLQMAVCGMPMPLRMVFLLCVVEQLRYEQIAAIIQVPIDTVIARLAEAHAFLREASGSPPPIAGDSDREPE